MKTIKVLLLLSLGFILTGCAQKKPYDYTAFHASKPKSILILPPINNSPDVKASSSFYSNAQKPLAEAGYYVFPIALVNETFKRNGMTVAEDIHQIKPKKLQEIFGADSALYITIKDYGNKYFIIGSSAVVTADAKLVDLRSSAILWEGTASAKSDEGSSGQGDLASILVNAAAKQIIGTVFDESHGLSKKAAAKLLSADTSNGILYGPYHPNYGKMPQ
jgi:hypothetical protein